MPQIQADPNCVNLHPKELDIIYRALLLAHSMETKRFADRIKETVALNGAHQVRLYPDDRRRILLALKSLPEDTSELQNKLGLSRHSEAEKWAQFSVNIPNSL